MSAAPPTTYAPVQDLSSAGISPWAMVLFGALAIGLGMIPLLGGRSRHR